MKFKLDENLPLEIVEVFQTAGHEVETVYDEGLAGAADQEILRRVRQERRILLTMDKGIADVRAFPPSDYSGIVLFRPETTGRGEVLRFARSVAQLLLSLELTGRLVIVSPRGIRTR